ncbi:MAG: hypothetical protein FJ304_00820 [Planctomycetes bacterium]|nr:hypothetical protein [Planctomycetota bacterium]
MNGVHWVAADEPFRPLPPEIFLRDYYEPKLLARVLAGEKLPAVRSVADLNRVQPLVRVVKVAPAPGAADEVSVTVEIAGQERVIGPALVRSGAADLHLFRDGRLVGLRAGPLALDPKTGRATVTFDRVKLPRAGQKGVEFSGNAFNVDCVKSDTHRRAHALPALDPHKDTAYIVCVGVNGSDEPKWDLRFAAPDAKLMGDTLAAGLKASGRYERVVVTLLSEPTFDNVGKRTGIVSTATKANVRAALGALAGEKPPSELVRAVPGLADLRAARPEDAVILTFSTHGFNGTGGRFYLFPSDIGKGRDVTDDTLKRAVDKRMRVLDGSRTDDVALEDDRVGHGLLTYALCKDGLTKNRADFDPPNGVVSVGEWLRYGVGRVPGLADEVASGKARAVSSTGRARARGRQAIGHATARALRLHPRRGRPRPHRQEMSARVAQVGSATQQPSLCVARGYAVAVSQEVAQRPRS